MSTDLGTWILTKHFIHILALSEQCGDAVGDQLQGKATHGDQWGEEAPWLPDCSAEPPSPVRAGAHGQLGGEECHQQHHSSTGLSFSFCLMNYLFFFCLICTEWTLSRQWDVKNKNSVWVWTLSLPIDIEVVLSVTSWFKPFKVFLLLEI